MRNALFRYIAMASASIALSLASGGCSGDEFDVPEQSADGVAIHFYSTRQTTRATGDQEPGINDLNENKLTSLAVALYPLSAGDDTPATKFQVFTGFNDEGSHTERISLKKEEIAALFGADAPTGSQCKVYAVANLSVETLERIKGGTPSISALKNLEITSDFSSKQTQQSFVMSGNGLATFTSAGDNSSATGDIPLYRTAAKITLNVKLPEKVQESEGSDVYWYPLENNGTMRVLLNNGVNKSTVVADVSNILSDGYFDINTNNDNTWGFTDNSAENPEYKWKQTYPFYTYPNKWENTPSEMHRTTLTLIIPWQKGNADGLTETTYETFYYSVPVTATELTELTSNYSYQIDLNVNMLGSRAPEQPEEIDGNYKVVDWMTENMDVNIKDYRYLIVNPKTYDVNNLEEFTLSFNSSHPVEVADITMRYNRFAYITETGNTNMGAVVSFPTSKEVIDRSTTGSYVMVDYTKDMLDRDSKTKQYTFKLKHELKIWTPINNANATTITDRNTVSQTGYTSLTGTQGSWWEEAEPDTTTVQNSIKKYLRPTNPETAYSPYVFTITLRHKDNKNFSETFTVIQYPAMWIKAVKNPRNGPNNNHPGNNFVNGGADYDNSNGLGSISTLRGNNRNPNMYVITVSKLDNNSKYYIGDPRTLYYDNNLSTRNGASLTTPVYNGGAASSNWCRQAPALYPNSNQRRLTYYYPTIESEDDFHKMMIAPKLRVASSYGTTNDIDRTNARRRCATYQEENCPSGRWRVPTYGELLYIIELSANKKIPTLFSPGGTGYWCAQGAYSVQTNGTLTSLSNTDDHAVRCVYDEWYWEDETNYTISPDSKGVYTYTLGDMPKRNPQN